MAVAFISPGQSRSAAHAHNRAIHSWLRLLLRQFAAPIADMRFGQSVKGYLILMLTMSDVTSPQFPIIHTVLFMP